MKTTVVPAQVTTVEDKVAGNLSVIQLFLLTLPVFLNGVLFGFFPPMMKVTALKVVLGVLLSLTSATMAIRIKGKILLVWLVTLIRYNVRPRYYTFNKNDLYLRDPLAPQPEQTESKEPVKKKTEKHIHLPHISIPELVRLETALADSRSNFRFETNRKGRLDVRISQIK